MLELTTFLLWAMMSILTLSVSSFEMDLGRKTLDVCLGERFERLVRYPYHGIILSVVGFNVSGSHAKVIILMCKVGVGSASLYS